MPPAHAQIAQVLELGTSLVNSIPKLFGLNQQNGGNGPRNNNDEENNNGQSNSSSQSNNNSQGNGSQSGDDDGSVSASHTVHKDKQDSASQSLSNQDSDSDSQQTDSVQQKRTTQSVHGKLIPTLDPSVLTPLHQSEQLSGKEQVQTASLDSYRLDLEKRITTAFCEHPISRAKVDVIATFEVTPKGVPHNIQVSSQAHSNDPNIAQEAAALINRAGPFMPLSADLAKKIKLKIHLTELPHRSFREYEAQVEKVEYMVIRPKGSGRSNQATY
jgi:hypothetical protein